ncbi:MAG: hypothetical protein E7479_04480 [Ruminococcaceae bacterium]|nr:hypothetical protein [Oscillospiraceae bacterium]
MSDDNFNLSYWYKKRYITPKEVREKLNSLHLEGRKIKRMKFIGLCYNFTEYEIEDAAYSGLKNLPEEERQLKSNYDNIDPNTEFDREVSIDEPFLIQFEDGDIFEIETPIESNFCIGMNTIPWGARAETNLPNIDANVLFSECIGQAVKKIEVNTFITDEEPLFREKFDEEPFKRELVSDVALYLENGLVIDISGFFDYCEVGCYESEDRCSKITFEELKKGMI